MIHDQQNNPDRLQNLIDSSLSHAPPLNKISSKSVHNFLRYLAHTDGQTHRIGWIHNRIGGGDYWWLDCGFQRRIPSVSGRSVSMSEQPLYWHGVRLRRRQGLPGCVWWDKLSNKISWRTSLPCEQVPVWQHGSPSHLSSQICCCTTLWNLNVYCLTLQPSYSIQKCAKLFIYSKYLPEMSYSQSRVCAD